MSEHSGFIRHNGIRVVSVDEEKACWTADVTPENSNIWGGVHGGFLYAMADTCRGRVRAHQLRPAQRHAERLDQLSALDYAVQKTLTAVGRPVRVGGHIGFFRGQYHRRHRRADRPRRDQHVFSEKVRTQLKGGASGLARCAPFSFFRCGHSVFLTFTSISAVTASATGLRSASRKNTLTFAAFDQSAFAHASVTVSAYWPSPTSPYRDSRR